MKQTILDITLTTTEPTLGLASSNPEIQREFIASKAPDLEKQKEEMDAVQVEEEMQKATTIFPKDSNGIFWWDYQMRGAFKGFFYQLIELGDCKLSKWTYKRSVDLFLFVEPRKIYIRDSSGQIYKTVDKTLQRPLRAETRQGDRIALASSELIAPGAQWDFTVRLLTGTNKKTTQAIITPEDIKNCLDMGIFSGCGQWRGGGYGRFTYEMKLREVKE